MDIGVPLPTDKLQSIKIRQAEIENCDVRLCRLNALQRSCTLGTLMHDSILGMPVTQCGEAVAEESYGVGEQYRISRRR